MTDIRTAMVLAAGLGIRMKPLTDTMPKPLIPVSKKPLIDYALDRFAEAGIEKSVVNVHYFADQLEKHLATRISPAITISDERDEVLETGGGLVKAKRHFGNEAFFCTNTDAILVDYGQEACASLAAAWNDETIDALLLLCPPEAASGYSGKGDFLIEENGNLHWPGDTDETVKRYIFTGLQILHPRLFEDEPVRAVSTKVFWDKAMASGRMRGLIYHGRWMHVGDPAGLAEAEAWMASARQEDVGQKQSAQVIDDAG